MRYHDCDQIANDLLVAAEATSKKFGLPCRLDIMVGEQLVEELDRLDKSSYRLADTVDYVLSGTQFEIVEREGYRRALTKIIGRRKGAARTERIAHDKATDFPRGQEL